MSQYATAPLNHNKKNQGQRRKHHQEKDSYEKEK